MSIKKLWREPLVHFLYLTYLVHAVSGRLALVKRRVNCYHFATTLSESSMPKSI
jgi:hypothetical protein